MSASKKSVWAMTLAAVTIAVTLTVAHPVRVGRATNTDDTCVAPWEVNFGFSSQMLT